MASFTEVDAESWGEVGLEPWPFISVVLKCCELCDYNDVRVCEQEELPVFLERSSVFSS
jgi:hypothetical protein